MGKEATDFATVRGDEAFLKDELDREERALGTIAPILRHMLASDGHVLVSDALVARVRGMLSDVAAQMLALRSGRDPSLRVEGDDGDTRDQLAERLAGDGRLLAFCHALAFEGLLAEQLERRASIDPVLSPLLQELIASQDPAVAEIAMNTLAVQSRFMQAQRRMELPLRELPAELFAAVIAECDRTAQDAAAGPAISETLARVRANYDEGSGRLGLLTRLVSTMRRGAVAALSLDHAGLALFASALAALSRQRRERALLACHEGQGLRLALGLRAAGLEPEAIDRQLLLTACPLPLAQAMRAITPDRAAAIVSGSAASGLE